MKTLFIIIVMALFLRGDSQPKIYRYASLNIYLENVTDKEINKVEDKLREYLPEDTRIDITVYEETSK